jgi:hypothetical protein
MTIVIQPTTKPAHSGAEMLAGFTVSRSPAHQAQNTPQVLPAIVMRRESAVPPVWKKHPHAITAAHTRKLPYVRNAHTAIPPRNALLKEDDKIMRIGSPCYSKSSVHFLTDAGLKLFGSRPHFGLGKDLLLDE